MSTALCLICLAVVVLISWTNPSSPFATNYVTTIETSSDFKSWQTVISLPYATNGSVRFTNAAPMGFYRVANSIKP